MGREKEREREGEGGGEETTEVGESVRPRPGALEESSPFRATCVASE
jgi:hypothetical protein